MSLSFPDTPKKITPAKQVTITIAQTQAAGFVTRARGVMSGERSSFVVTETFGVSTSIVKSRNARVRGACCYVGSQASPNMRHVSVLLLKGRLLTRSAASQRRS
jgi:hypothetical protein